MKRVIIILLVMVSGLILLVGFAALLGSRLPSAHVASRSILLHKSPHDVYAVVRDFGSAPAWRSDLTKVEVDGPVNFREVGKNGSVNYELIEDVPDERMVIRIRDTDLGYSGRWTYQFASENDGTRVTIREDGEVTNVLFRFMSHYVFSQTATIESYLTALAKRFGEEAVLQ